MEMSTRVAEAQIMHAFQELSRRPRKTKNERQSGGPSTYAVVGDSGATVRVIGTDDVDRIVPGSMVKLAKPVTVHGSAGASVVTHKADLPDLLRWGYG